MALHAGHHGTQASEEEQSLRLLYIVSIQICGEGRAIRKKGKRRIEQSSGRLSPGVQETWAGRERQRQQEQERLWKQAGDWEGLGSR